MTILHHNPLDYAKQLVLPHFDETFEQHAETIEGMPAREVFKEALALGAALAHEDLTPHLLEMIKLLRTTVADADREIAHLTDLGASSEALDSLANVRNPVAKFFEEQIAEARRAVIEVLHQTYGIGRLNLLNDVEFDDQDYAVLGFINARRHAGLFGGWMLVQGRLESMPCQCPTCMIQVFEDATSEQHRRAREAVNRATPDEGTDMMRRFGRYIRTVCKNRLADVESLAPSHGQVDPGAAQSMVVDMLNKLRRGDNDPSRGD